MKLFAIYLLLNLSFYLVGQNKQLLINDSISGDSILNFSKSFIGTNYCYGSCEPKKGFDCSGFVYYVFILGKLRPALRQWARRAAARPPPPKPGTN